MRIQLYKNKIRTYKNTTKKKNFINRILNGEREIFCICLDEYEPYDVFNEKFDILSTMESKKLNVKNEVVEKYSNMDAEFEQTFSSGAAKIFYENGHDFIGLLQWIPYFDRYFEKLNYFD